jgi:hypothetical protein
MPVTINKIAFLFLVAGLIFAPAVFAQSPPLGVWSFDTAGANPTLDDTGAGQNGTLYGQPDYDTDTPAPLAGGNSLSFNGTSDYVALNMSLSSNGALPQLTASAWFKTSYTSNGAWSDNWAFLDFDRSEYFNFCVTPDGRIAFSTTDSTGADTYNNNSGLHDMYSTATGLNDGAWHHVAVVYDGVDKHIYVDGGLDSTVTNAHGSRALGSGTTRFAFIGDGSEATGFNGARNRVLYQGKIDEVALWSVGLTASQVSDIASGGPVLFVDSDGDGVSDDQDVCNGGDDNVDFDNDGVPDFCDDCPLDVFNDSDGDAVCDSDDLCLGDDATGDSDSDGLCDDSDPCTGASNSDNDGDGICDEGDLCYGDDASGNDDGDGVCNDLDACVGDDATGDTDGDFYCDDIDACPLDPENDADGDGICESIDNCPLIDNDNQSDLDGDGTGDACDGDIDGDGLANESDNCVFDANPDQADLDNDGAGDVCDEDFDGDGVLDAVDACVPSPVGAVVNTNGCAISDLCPCEHPDGSDRWKNHGAYVKCVAHTANDFVDVGLISGADHGLIVSEAGESSCGHKNR